MNRLFKEGLATTIIGLIIILVSLFMWFLGKATQSESAAMIGVGVGLFVIKDKHIGIKR